MPAGWPVTLAVLAVAVPTPEAAAETIYHVANGARTQVFGAMHRNRCVAERPTIPASPVEVAVVGTGTTASGIAPLIRTAPFNAGEVSVGDTNVLFDNDCAAVVVTTGMPFASTDDPPFVIKFKATLGEPPIASNLIDLCPGGAHTSTAPVPRGAN